MATRLLPISTDLILKRMRFENPWWETNTIDNEYNTLQRRSYFDLFFKLVEETEIRRAVVLMGPRRVGKTVLMHHAICDLIRKNKIRNTQICFINIENPLYLNMGLEELFDLCRGAVANEDPKGWYVFFDEIQYLKNWEVHLKVLVDSYPNTKFIVSGSAAAALKLKSSESGAGRFTDFMLPPLTFYEYIQLMNLTHLVNESSIYWKKQKTFFYSTAHIDLFNRHFVEYINFGGYPEVIFPEKIKSNVSRFIKSDIIDKVLLRDLPSLFGIQDVQELNTFFTRLVYYTGTELSLDSLSTSSGVNKHTLKKYLEYLEAAFLIKQIHKIDESGKHFQRQTAYKIYLTNPSLRSALFSPLEPTDDMIGNMVETAIFSQWLHRTKSIPWYARWNGGEVDMVGLDAKKQKPLWAVEIKWSNKCFNSDSELKSILHFCEKNKLTDAFVTTLDKWGQREVNGVTINFLPSSVYAYTVGFNTLASKFQEIIS
jgi:uncharacterized protein